MNTSLKNKLARFFRGDDGTTVVEYSVMLAMIVLLAIAAILSTGQEAGDFYEHNADEIGDAL